jgi:hypothetical protein
MKRFDDEGTWEDIMRWVKDRSIGAGPDAEALIERLVEVDLECEEYSDTYPAREDPELIRNYAMVPSVNGQPAFEACAFRIRIPDREEIALYFEVINGKISKYGELAETGLVL